jgi:tetratricopeptide (TPR) repeat protein
VQDEITARVSAAIQPALERTERERAARKPPESLDAWECYHRGMWHFANFEAGEIEKARSFFQGAIELDPRFAPAYAMLARTYLRESNIIRSELRPHYVPRALDYARRAIAIDPTDASGHAALAGALMNSGRHAEGIGHYPDQASTACQAAPAAGRGPRRRGAQLASTESALPRNTSRPGATLGAGNCTPTIQEAQVSGPGA